MKKYLILFLLITLTMSQSIARDYTKIQTKELKHAQKYNTTQVRTKNFTPTIYPQTIKTKYRDPHILLLGSYEKIDDEKYNEKLAKDEKEYKKYEDKFDKVTLTNFNSQAQGRDYYRIYRIAERIIRANKLDYQVWRIGISREAEEINAFSTSGNYIYLNTSMIDSFIDNDDALASVIGHEIAHILLGHQKRRMRTIETMDRMARLSEHSNIAKLNYIAFKKKFIIDSKNMEYAADIEGAKLAAKAGYSMNKANDVLYLFESIDSDKDYYKTHPAPDKRIESFDQNIKYFPIEEWRDWGRYNIYNTSPLKVEASSDRKSIVISPTIDRSDKEQYYHPETMEELFLRFGYTSYLNGEFEKSLDYFKKYFDINDTNAAAYLYASYAAEEYYKQTSKTSYLNLAKEYINKGYELDKSNKYIKDQLQSLSKK